MLDMLEKLMEKKDLKTYLKFRKEFLQKNRQKMVLAEDLPEDKRKVNNMVEGRIRELEKLENTLTYDELKEKSKHYWRKNNNGEKAEA